MAEINSLKIMKGIPKHWSLASIYEDYLSFYNSNEHKSLSIVPTTNFEKINGKWRKKKIFHISLDGVSIEIARTKQEAFKFAKEYMKTH